MDWSRSKRVRAAGALAVVLLAFSVARLATSVEALDLRLKESRLRNGGSWTWGYLSPRIRELDLLLTEVRRRIPPRSVVVVDPGAGSGEPQFLFTWSQFLAPELDFRLAGDMADDRAPRYRLVLDDPARLPEGVAPLAKSAAGWLVASP